MYINKTKETWTFITRKSEAIKIRVKYLFAPLSLKLLFFAPSIFVTPKKKINCIDLKSVDMLDK
jgi:hypothetical protein